MYWTTRWHRAIGGLLVVAMTAGTLSTPAEAKTYRRYKGGGPAYGVRTVSHPVYYRSRGSSAVPFFVGGLILGVALTHAAAAHAEYVYEDPYCHRAYASYDSYWHHHGRYCRHPRVVRVIEVRSGRCVRTSRYDDGHWVDGGYYQRGYRDGRYDDRDYDRRYKDRTWDREHGDWDRDREYDDRDYEYEDD